VGYGGWHGRWLLQRCSHCAGYRHAVQDRRSMRIHECGHLAPEWFVPPLLAKLFPSGCVSDSALYQRTVCGLAPSLSRLIPCNCDSLAHWVGGLIARA